MINSALPRRAAFSNPRPLAPGSPRGDAPRLRPARTQFRGCGAALRETHDFGAAARRGLIAVEEEEEWAGGERGWWCR